MEAIGGKKSLEVMPFGNNLLSNYYLNIFEL